MRAGAYGVANVAYRAKNLAPFVEARVLIVAVCKKDKEWPFGHCRPGGSEGGEHEKSRVALVYSVMSYVKAKPANTDVHIWSAVPVSVNRASHKIWEAVKGRRATPPSWGCSFGYKTAGKMITKLSHQFCRLLHNNDQGQLDIRLTLAPLGFISPRRLWCRS